MSLFTGEITELLTSDGSQWAKVRVGGTSVQVPLMLLSDVCVGDRILIEAGVAIAKVDIQHQKENPHVSGHPGKGA